MIYYLLDTNIISELSKQEKNPGVVKKIAQYSDCCAISAITYQEIAFGLKKMPFGRKRSDFENIFYGFIVNTFPIINYTSSEANIYADFQSNCEKRGLPRPYFDTQIAATAKANALILVTRNVKDFEPFIEHENLMVENWFE